ncbi:AMP-binding protein [Burkholderia multivorans]|uniref:AMP-binding protein n=1 Tax=Burkholderia multivorans TaxID=87883 RepID=UPI001C22A3BF|nr:AMP-binding protein [Burkholderia multivorans]MBU9443611.1 AMP-binding protein [Burkholderia multivorans]MBU9605521.1 AMP-binding protein [Burkholderia multivorans]MBU9624969.1 AMP-binding protein [Burkholderia multivorans]
MNIAQLLVRTASAFADRLAVLHGEQPWLDYGSLAKRTAALAGFLRDQCGVKPGARVAIYSENCPEYLEALHSIYWAGAVSVPVNFKLHPKELAFILANAEADVLFVSEALLATLREAAIELPASCLVFGSSAYAQALEHAPIAIEHREPDDIASLFYTSGTTGRPKGVMQTHRNLLTMTACYFMDVDDVRPEDAMVYAAPMSHGAGLYNFPYIARGARHVVPRSGGLDCAELVELASRVGQLSMFAAPTMVKRLVDHVRAARADVSGFKTIIYGGGPMYANDLHEALEVFGPRLVQVYGQGESPMTITALDRGHLADTQHPRWAQRATSVGIAQSLVEVQVVDDRGRRVPNGEIGEVIVRGDTVMPGYWRNPEATASTIRDGWLYTGDTGYMDDDGFLTLKDRSKDLIISGGSNIYPREIEEVLLAHPSVSEVAVVGWRDAEWGEVPVAFVVFKEGCDATQHELDEWCLQSLARFKRPKRYEFVLRLPKNSYGKVLKTELRSAD